MGVELRISRFEFPCSRPRFFQCYFERQFYCFQNGTFKQRLKRMKFRHRVWIARDNRLLWNPVSPCPFHGLDYFANENIVLLLSTIPLQFILHRVYFSALYRKVTEQSVYYLCPRRYPTLTTMLAVQKTRVRIWNFS